MKQSRLRFQPAPRLPAFAQGFGGHSRRTSQLLTSSLSASPHQGRADAKKLISIAVIAGLLLPGCGGYQKRSLNIFKQRPANYEQTINDVTMKVNKLTQEECEQVFGRRAQNLTLGQSGINPLVLSIENNSATRWELAENNIGLQLSEPEEVAQRLKLNTALYAGGIFGIGIGITAFVALNFVGILSVMSGSFNPYAFLFVPLILGTGGYYSIVGASGFALYSGLDNKSIDDATVKVNAVIKSGKTLGGLLFVNKPDYKSKFTITLQEKKDPKLVRRALRQAQDDRKSQPARPFEKPQDKLRLVDRPETMTFNVNLSDKG